MKSKSRKNIVVLNQFACLPENLYGPGERIYHLSKYLNNDTFEIELVSGSYNHLFKYPPDIKEDVTIEKLPNLKLIWLKLRKYRRDSFVGRVISWFEFVYKLFKYQPHSNPDIIVVSSMSLLPIIYALWQKRKYGAKLVLEIRDIWPLTPIELGGYSKFNPLILLLRKVEILGYKHADYIVSVLPGFDRYLKENGFGKKPFKWIPNGTLDLETQTADPQLIFELDKKKFNVIYAGTIGKANALDSFISAARMLESNTDIQFNIVGGGPSEDELKSLGADLNNLSFFPMVMKSKLPSILKSADVGYIGWHDRRIYNYGVAANKYNDYMQAELPIISSSNILEDPVVLANAGIRVAPDKPEEIVSAILALHSDPDKCNLLGKNGKSYVSQHHIYPKLGEKYLEVFTYILNPNEN